MRVPFSPMEDRLAHVQSLVRSANNTLSWWQGIRGLTLQLDTLRALGASPEFLEQWTLGVPLGAQAAAPSRVPNHPSLVQNDSWAAAEWDRLEKLGKVFMFPPGAPPPPKLNVNPCALLLKPREGADDSAPEIERWKARLILDLRRGRVNERLPQVGVAYGTLDMAVSRLKQGSHMFVIDLQDCFFNWRVRPEDADLLGFYCPGRQQYGRYEYLPFGLAPAPGVNDSSIKEILRLLRQSRGIDLLDFVDDMFGEGDDSDAAWNRLESAVRIFIKIGVPVSSKPTGIRAPSTRQCWIGWVFDSIQGVVTVSQDKCDKVCKAIAQTLEADAARALRAKELASAAGLASHLGELYPQARRRLHPVWGDLNAAGVYAMWAQSPRANPLVHLSNLSRRNLQRALDAFATPPVRALHSLAGQLSSWGHKSPEYSR